MCTFKSYQDCQKRGQLNSEMLCTMDDWLRINDEVTASELKPKLHEWCTNFPDVDLSVTIKRLQNHCILWCYPVVYKFVQSCRHVSSVSCHYNVASTHVK